MTQPSPCCWAIDDVTALRDFSEARDRERLLAQSIVDTIRDPLVILEDDMTVVSASRAFLRLFGCRLKRSSAIR